MTIPIVKVFTLWCPGKCGLLIRLVLSMFRWRSCFGVLAVWVIVSSLFYLGVIGVLSLVVYRLVGGSRYISELLKNP